MSALLELLASSPAAFITTCLVFGLLIGSFLNVVIYRVPIILERQWREQCLELTAPGPAAGPTDAEAAVTPSVTHPTHESAGPANQADAPFNLVVPRSACPACKAPIRHATGM